MICTECEHAVDDHGVKGIAKIDEGCIKKAQVMAPINWKMCGCKLRVSNQEQLGESPYAIKSVDHELAEGTWITFEELTLRKLGFLIYLVDKAVIHEWPSGPDWDKFWLKDEEAL